MTGSFAFNSSKIHHPFKSAARGAFLLMVAIATPHAAAAAPQVVQMEAKLWETTGQPATFVRQEGFPDGMMTIKDESIAALKDQTFADGTIEFDIKALAYSDTGIIFRRQGTDGGEYVYLRADPDCPAANDCYQYAPITHGRMAWNIYPNYQGPAQISEKGWNHVRLVISGSHMEVFLNRSSIPMLVVPRLQGLTSNGGIAFKGPAIYANLTVDEASDGAMRHDVAQVQPPEQPGIVGQWLQSEPVPFADGQHLVADDAKSLHWQPQAAEPNGLVNLGRSVAPTKTTSVVWLKTTVYATQAGNQAIDVGFSGQTWLFVNGAPVYNGGNFYYPETTRLQVDGRLEVANAVVHVALKPGPNEILIAVSNQWRAGPSARTDTPYGWGAMLRFESPDGLRF